MLIIILLSLSFSRPENCICAFVLILKSYGIYNCSREGVIQGWCGSVEHREGLRLFVEHASTGLPMSPNHRNFSLAFEVFLKNFLTGQILIEIINWNIFNCKSLISVCSLVIG